MVLYITDNPAIRKNLKVDSLLVYQIFDWRIISEIDEEDNNEIFEIKKRFKQGDLRKKLKINQKIIAIVAPSNYKLIYDLLYIKKEYNKELILYSWESYYLKKRLKIDKKNITDLFNQYMQRGYLTLILYSPLSSMNLQRVEQFIALLIIETVNKLPKIDTPKIDKLSNIKENINTIGFIRVLCSNNYSLRKAIEKLIYHSRKLDITDPFTGSFNILKENNSLFKIHKENINSNEYIGIDNNNINGFIIVINFLNSIIPFVDTLKMLSFLAKNEYIDTIKETLSIKSSINFDPNELKLYSNYISSKTWRDIYTANDYAIGGLFPVIRINELSYNCPICNSNKLRSTPTTFSCSNIDCKLYVNRIVKPCGIKKQITENEFIRLIKHGKTIIKNKAGGYSTYILEEEKENCYKIIPKLREPINKSK